MLINRMNDQAKGPGRPRREWALLLLALGVVFGDIGTSPLYAFETAVGAAGGSVRASYGAASLILWTLFLVVMVKYGLLVMRAGYQGEGGVFALLAILRESGWLAAGPGKWMAGLLVFGAALLFGDGAITPAISVLSAVEGIEAVNPVMQALILPLAACILAVLFACQRFGTGRLGSVFGPVMLLWFVSLGLLGLGQILHAPEVLGALSPHHGLLLLAEDPLRAMSVMGAVVLAVTGAEALYADMGHFGRPAIFRAWRALVFPALALNYLGQAAHVVRFPESASDPNLFYLLVPEGMPRIGMILLATSATIIASQALISGIFSLCNQAIDLGYLPRLFVRHTSRTERGQIYVPTVNVLLGGICLLLVFIFRSSSALAGAYGIAVTGAMIVTSIGFASVAAIGWKLPRWQVGLLLAGLLAIDLPLFLACLGKLFDGGLVPVVLAAGVAAVMFTWRRGRDHVHRAMRFGAVSIDELGKRLSSGEMRRTPMMQVFPVRKPVVDDAVAGILEQYRRVQVVGEEIVILLLNPSWADANRRLADLTVREYPGGLWLVTATHGFMVEPNAPDILDEACRRSGGRLHVRPGATNYVVAHEMFIEGLNRLMPAWQRQVFAFLSRNVLPGPHYLGIPADRLLIFNWMLRVDNSQPPPIK